MNAPPHGPTAWLRAGSVELREFAPSDAADVARMHQAPRLREHLVDDHPLHELRVAEVFVQRIGRFYRQHPGLGIWRAGAAGVHGAPLLGWFSLMPMTLHPGEVELGCRLRPEAWGTGVALDGGEALLRHAFASMARACVWGVCHPHNRGARLCLAALGFSPCGMAPYDGRPGLHHRVDAGRWRDVAAQPRRERLRQAARSLRRPAEGHADTDLTPLLAA